MHLNTSLFSDRDRSIERSVSFYRTHFRQGIDTSLIKIPHYPTKHPGEWKLILVIPFFNFHTKLLSMFVRAHQLEHACLLTSEYQTQLSATRGDDSPYMVWMRRCIPPTKSESVGQVVGDLNLPTLEEALLFHLLYPSTLTDWELLVCAKTKTPDWYATLEVRKNNALFAVKPLIELRYYHKGEKIETMASTFEASY